MHKKKLNTKKKYIRNNFIDQIQLKPNIRTLQPKALCVFKGNQPKKKLKNKTEKPQSEGSITMSVLGDSRKRDNQPQSDKYKIDS